MTRSTLLARRALLLAPLALLVAGPAFANASKKEEKGKEGEAKVDPVIKLQALALPIIVNGKLVNYVFVQLSLTLKPDVLPTVFEGQEPMLRDAIVREAHSKPFTRPDSYSLLDETRLKASILRETGALIGPGMVALVTVIKQTPRNFIAPPPKPVPAGSQTAAKPAARQERGDPNIVP